MSISRVKQITRTALSAALLAAALAPAQQAAANNSGRYVVADGNGGWRAVEAGHPGAVFYPSWYAGVDLSQSDWKAGDFESEATGVGLVVGNHFKPQLRWELRHRQDRPEGDSKASAGDDYSTTSLALDYLVEEPADGFSSVLRAGVASADGDALPDEQSEVEALLGLGLQWREDRWTVRAMLEQAGADQRWGSVVLSGYFGGEQGAAQRAPAAAKPVAVKPVAVKPVAVKPAPAKPVAPASTRPTPAAKPAARAPARTARPALPRHCGKVVSSRVMNNVAYRRYDSSELSERSRRELQQIGRSYARRDYVAVDVTVIAPSGALARDRGIAVVKALGADAPLKGRVRLRIGRGQESLTIAMRDTRSCR